MNHKSVHTFLDNQQKCQTQRSIGIFPDISIKTPLIITMHHTMQNTISRGQMWRLWDRFI